MKEAVASALSATAATVGAFGGDLKRPFVERDMQEILVGALTASLADARADLTVKPNFGVSFAEWPGVGPVDVALLDHQGAPATFLELKWGKGTLYNCIWDLPKMAVAVTRGHSRSAFLIAGAQASDWVDADGAELFDTARRRIFELFETYPKHWQSWKQDVKTHPVLLPTEVETVGVASVPLEVCAEDWQLRCVEVRAAGDEWWNVAEVEATLGI